MQSGNVQNNEGNVIPDGKGQLSEHIATAERARREPPQGPIGAPMTGARPPASKADPSARARLLWCECRAWRQLRRLRRETGTSARFRGSEPAGPPPFLSRAESQTAKRRLRKGGYIGDHFNYRDAKKEGFPLAQSALF
jgi:hypothetical protein